jgi:uncharacterized protein YodC (DUF2158 family)
MANQWNVGDRVQLQSGGPIMTVDEIGPDGVLCQWFGGNTKLEYGTFKPQALKAAPRSGGGVVLRDDPDLM